MAETAARLVHPTAPPAFAWSRSDGDDKEELAGYGINLVPTANVLMTQRNFPLFVALSAPG
jgi:hypothetical protein